MENNQLINVTDNENNVKETFPKQNKQQEPKKTGRQLPFNWITAGILVSFIAAVLYTSMYGLFEKQANTYSKNPLENINDMTYMYQNVYVLYKDLYNKQHQTEQNYSELYLNAAEGYAEELLHMDVLEKAVEDEKIDSAIQPQDASEEDIFEIYQNVTCLEDRFRGIEAVFSDLNATYDYLIEDTNTGEYITNLSSPEINKNDQFFYICFLFDEYGNVTLDGDIKGSDTTLLRKNANDIMRNCSIGDLLEAECGKLSKYVRVVMPQNCRIIFCISKMDWQNMQGNGDFLSLADTFRYSDSNAVVLLFVLLVLAAGLFLTKIDAQQTWKKVRICQIPLELWVGILYVLVGICPEFVPVLVMWVVTGNGANSLNTVLSLRNNAADLLVICVNLVILTALFFVSWYLGINMRAVRELKWREYVKQRSLIYRIFPFCKNKLLEFYDMLQHFDVTRNANKLILKIILVNAVALFIISSLWRGGVVVAVIYSILLYFVLRKYISDLQKRYSILLKATNEIAQGNLNVEITEDLGVFEPFKPQIIRIEEGFKKAVEEEVKSQRMKSELITNVSHDLKTPLTAIITYVGLLKQKNITEEQRMEYLDTLERKSLRLKVLIEDLFEVSKATSKNVTLHIMDIDIINLIKQVSFEMSDKLADSQLDLRLNLPEEKVILSLDSQKTYRIFENLFGNVAKYALPGTRVYLDCMVMEEEVYIILKNIAAEELHVTPEDLTERFVRGDSSRNTEGSGLGLAIAKSFTELQDGKLEIQLDGDLFKVTLCWKRNHTIVQETR